MVTVYSATWCAFCRTAKDYLDKLGVKYTVKDVEHDEGAGEESIQKSQQTGIPVLDIDGTIIVGFDKPKIDEVLKQNHLI
jgi:glutaredoxin-like YruB-family protein